MKLNFFKPLLIISIAGFINNSYAATSPGANVSRANCWAPFFMLDTGVGWYNESFTYSKIGIKHKAYVTSTQSLKGSSRQDNLRSAAGYITDWRIYAGRAEPTESTSY